MGHVQQPVGSKQVGEAAATIKRVGRKGDKEAHTRALVLQVAAAGAPLSLLCRSSLRLQRPARNGESRGGASAWTPPLAARTPPSGDPPSSQWAFFKPRPQLHLLGQAPLESFVPVSFLIGACAYPSSALILFLLLIGELQRRAHPMGKT